MGMDWRYGKAIFIIGRLPGLVVHVQEEFATGKPFDFAARVNAQYVGERERPLPEDNGS
jgi:citrate synthase